VTIPQAAVLAAPQVAGPYSTASSKDDASASGTKFAQALVLAGFTRPASPAPAAYSRGAQAAKGPQRSAKDATGQTRATGGNALAVTAPASQPVIAPLPLWMRSFAADAGDEQPVQPSDGGAATADSLPVTSNPQALATATAPLQAVSAPAQTSTQAFAPQETDSVDGATAVAAGAAPPPSEPSTTQQTDAVGTAAATVAGLAASLPPTSALPLWTPSFSGMTGSRGQSSRTQSSQPSLRVAGRQQQDAPTTKEIVLPAGCFLAEQAASPAGKAAETLKAAATQADFVSGTSKAPVPQNSRPAPSGELAFATRMQPEPAAKATATVPPQPLQHDLASAAPTPSKKTDENDGDDVKAVAPVPAGAGASFASYGQTPENQPGPSLPEPEPANSAPPSPVEVPQAQPKPASIPVKDISLQVTQPGEQKVEVRIVQQSGELRVAVHTGDSDLAHGLQQGLSDLVGRLQETGFRTEAWYPGGTGVHSTPVVEARTNAGGSQNGDSQGNFGGSRQQEGERRQNQSQRPEWVEELDNRIAHGEQSQGASYGIGS